MLSTDGLERYGRADAISGFDAIATALDQGLEADCHAGTRLRDAFAIGFGWLALVAVVFHPGLQLAAIALGVALLSIRSFTRLIFGSEGRAQHDLAAFRSSSSQLLPGQ